MLISSETPVVSSPQVDRAMDPTTSTSVVMTPPRRTQPGLCRAQKRINPYTAGKNRKDWGISLTTSRGVTMKEYRTRPCSMTPRRMLLRTTASIRRAGRAAKESTAGSESDRRTASGSIRFWGNDLFGATNIALPYGHATPARFYPRGHDKLRWYPHYYWAPRHQSLPSFTADGTWQHICLFIWMYSCPPWDDQIFSFFSYKI